MSRLRRGTLNLEQLHIKVRTVVSKAAPGPWTSLTEINAREAFLTALNDGELRRRIMMTCPPPETLSVHDLAVRSLSVDDAFRDESHESNRMRQHYIRTVTSGEDNASQNTIAQLREENRLMKNQIADLQAALKDLSAQRPVDCQTSEPQSLHSDERQWSTAKKQPFQVESATWQLSQL